MDRRLENQGIGTLLSAAADLVLPRECIACRRILLPGEKHMCTECLADMPFTRFWEMSRNPMADKLNERIESGCQTSGERYAYACALYYYTYESPYDRISQSLKYWRAFGVGRHFSEMLGHKIAGAPFFKDIDIIIPVPLHWSRRLLRGYNQAEIIARALSEVLGAPCRTDLLIRVRRTATQTEMSGSGKASNVLGAFKATGKQGVFGHILLVDDVFTSGSTTWSCFSALRQVYGTDVRISVATLGYVQE